MEKIYIKIARYFFTGIVHAVALYIIYKIWQPIAEWYLKQIPARGIDLYNSVSYVSYLLNNFALRVYGLKYTWFSGEPLALDYPSLYFYLMIPFASYFGLVQGVQLFAIVASFAFIGCCYLLFAALSKNRILAVILAIATAYSVNIYRALVYAGGIPVFAAQVFLPLVLYLIVKFIQTKDKRFLLIAGVLSGIGFMGHPQQFINYIFPSVIILLIVSHYERTFFTVNKIKNVILYLTVSILTGFPQFYPLLKFDLVGRLATMFQTTLFGVRPIPQGPSTVYPEQIVWARNQFYVAFSDTNPAVFHLLAIGLAFFIVGIVIGRSRLKEFINTIALGLVAGWVILYIYLLSIGIDLYHGGWEAWYKLFWPMPVVIGALASKFWGVFAHSISERVQHAKSKIALSFGIEIASGLILVFLGLFLFSSYTKNVIDRIDLDISVFTGTFPEALGARLTNKDLARVKKEIQPTFLEDSPGNYRLYSNEQTLNLWWNALFKTPLARGYIDPPLLIQDRGGYFWMDAAFSKGKKGGSSLGDDWDTPDVVVENNIPFLLDWFAIKYLEGNHGSSGGTGGLANVLTSEKYVDKTEERIVSGGIYRSTIRGESHWIEDRTQKVPFYKIKDSLVSPIHQATNAPAVLVIGGGDSFDIILRTVAMMGFSSQQLIIADGPSHIDDMKLSQLEDFDAIILYKYDYRNYSKSWDRIGKYLERGGHVFIDTGAEVKESSSVDLPNNFSNKLHDIFPIKQTKREDLGKTWKIGIKDKDLFKDVELDDFSDFIFDNKPWNISYPPNKGEDITEDSEILLTVHEYPVLVEKSVGLGKLIWSGVNLPYHSLYNYNLEEGKLFVNILGRLFSFGAEVPYYRLDWISPQKRIIYGKNAKGVLVKEQHFDGWSANVKSAEGTRTVDIYNVGPTTPGFMYIRIPKKMQSQEFSATFSYKGSLMSWTANIISIISIILVIDYVLFKNKLGKLTHNHTFGRIRKFTKKWWEKEEEE